jgi:polygalacturonase
MHARHFILSKYPFTVALRGTLLFCLALVFVPTSWADGGPSDAKAAWAQLPGLLKSFSAPHFPNRKLLITNYGAVGDGTTDCTEAFRKAIQACTDLGGGRVVVPAGTFLTGAIHLKNNVDLYLERKATIRFTTNTEGYMPPVLARYEGTEVMNYSPLVYAFEQTNIAITGEGTLDGQGSKGVWHHWITSGDPRRLVQTATSGTPVEQRIFGEGHYLRPNFVVPFRCRNVLIEGVHITDSPMWVLNPVYCTNVIVRNVTVNAWGPNTDGCDPDSCANVLIQDDNFSDGDDCIAIKSGRDRDGQRINIPCQNLVVRDCHFEAGHGGIAIGSETSGGVRNVFAENCHFDSPNLEMALRFKTNPARGGYITDVHVRDCNVKLAQIGIDMTLRYGSSGAINGSAVPVIRDIDIRNCTFGQLTGRPIFIEGWSPANKITDITIADCRFLHAAETSYVTNATRIYLPDTTGSGLQQKEF